MTRIKIFRKKHLQSVLIFDILLLVADETRQRSETQFVLRQQQKMHYICGRGSAVEHRLAKARVAGSI
ncbi:hypothetical protein, partial [Paenibacillus selenitireducens]|uniref:hypothetical protein n=1 Tax=Paenibacillus selenitireducens TaxID=1324314 RepID=UPI001E360B58